MKRQEILTTNDVIDIFLKKRSRVKLHVKKLDQYTIFIEGRAEAFEFLGRFLLAFSDEDDCTTHISPKSAGSRWFTKNSKFGFYFHKLPCTRNVVLKKFSELRMVSSQAKNVTR